MRAGPHQRGNAQVQRRLAAGRCDGANAAFKRRDALLQHRVGRVADARVNVSRALQIEERSGLVTGLENEGRGEVNWHRARTGCRVRRGTGVQCQGVKARVRVAGHGFPLALLNRASLSGLAWSGIIRPHER